VEIEIIRIDISKMIFNLLINFVLLIVGGLASMWPVVTIASIPWIGPVLSSSLITAVQYYNNAVATLPYLSVGMHVFLIVILPFEGLLLLFKVFFGHRVPAHMN